MRVNVICRNLDADRILPRFARYLRDGLGWSLTPQPERRADVYYLMGYFERQMFTEWPPALPTASLFTHREERDAGKAELYDQIARDVKLRVAMCRMYAEPLEAVGPTITPTLPVERDRFVPSPHRRPARPVVGLAGYTYGTGRKGEKLVAQVSCSAVGRRVDWRATGRGWPVPTQSTSWRDMPAYYQGLDVYLSPSLVEGGPMPVLEALACGVPVVVPRGVGILDELPDVVGIYRYERGDAASMAEALERAAFPDVAPSVDELRAVTEENTVEGWCASHAQAFDESFNPKPIGHDIELAPLHYRWGRDGRVHGLRGIYCVAFGAGARKCAARMIETAKRQMPDVPIALCAAEPIGGEDVLIRQPDSDVGGRRAKLRAYELTPSEWETVLYLDADTEVVAPIYPLFDWLEDGWDFVICRDVGETLHSFRRKNNLPEMWETVDLLGGFYSLQFNGGVWGFRRGEPARALLSAWGREWERHAQRDQGALVRAIWQSPLRMLVLGNEWNTFPAYVDEDGKEHAGYTPTVTTAGINHYPGEARRWVGKLPGRIDSAEAWAAVKTFEARRGTRP